MNAVATRPSERAAFACLEGELLKERGVENPRRVFLLLVVMVQLTIAAHYYPYPPAFLVDYRQPRLLVSGVQDAFSPIEEAAWEGDWPTVYQLAEQYKLEHVADYPYVADLFGMVAQEKLGKVEFFSLQGPPSWQYRDFRDVTDDRRALYRFIVSFRKERELRSSTVLSPAPTRMPSSYLLRGVLEYNVIDRPRYYARARQ